MYYDTLSLRCYLLDDTFFHIWWLFAEWIAEYSATTGLVGYYREELDLHPTLIYFRDGKVYISEVTQRPISIHDGTPW